MSLTKSIFIFLTLISSAAIAESEYGNTEARKKLIDALADELIIEETKAAIKEAKKLNEPLVENEGSKNNTNTINANGFVFPTPNFIEDAELIEIFDKTATFLFEGEKLDVATGESIKKYKLISLDSEVATLQRKGKKYHKRLKVMSNSNSSLQQNNVVLPSVLFSN